MRVSTPDPMLLERSRPIGSHDTAGDLHDALAELGAAALHRSARRARRRHAHGRAHSRRRARATRPRSKSRKRRSTGRRAPSQLDRQMRAFNPWPIAETRFGRRNACACCARGSPSPGGVHAAPGTLLGIADDGLRVACGEGVLAVRELQRAGKRPVSARDFANAVRLAGLRFGA